MNNKKDDKKTTKNSVKNVSKEGCKTPEKSFGDYIPLIEYKDLMDTEETCQFLKISVDTLYKWVEKKIIPHYKITGKKILFNRKKICQWLAECEVS